MAPLSESDKDRLRKHFQNTRKEYYDSQDAGQLSVQLAEQIESVLPEGKAVCAAYLNYGREASLDAFIQKHQEQFVFAVPRVEGDDLAFYRLKSATPLVNNQWQIPEPDPEFAESIDLNSCDFILVPGVAFDREGGRLGHGKGFYDRALSGYKGLKIGVAYSVQMSEEKLPSSDHDIPMDMVVTEKYVLKVIRKGKE